MPSEPLIFVEVALVDGMAGNIAALLDQSAPAIDAQDADTAIFYSISNAQRGLAGISFGDFLIKRVVDDLAAELKGLKTFATLSPVPGFRHWLDGMLAADGAGLLTDADAKALVAETGVDDGAGALRALLDMPWHEGEGTAQLLKQPLMKLCARYLLREKRGDGRPLDPVARFHLSNGARIARINWLGDPSVKGLAQSAGMMVNYVYKLDDIEENHEAYSDEGKVVAASSVRGLARRERAARGGG